MCPFKEAPVTWVNSPATHLSCAFWHHPGRHIASLCTSSGVAHVVLGAFSSHVTSFCIAPCYDNPWQKQDNLSHDLYFECCYGKAFLQSSLHKKLGKLSASPMLTSCFHREVVPASKGRGQVHRKNMGKSHASLFVIKVLVKQVKTLTLHSLSPPEIAKINKYIQAHGSLPQLSCNEGENGLLMYRNLPDPSLELTPSSLLVYSGKGH